MLPFRQGRQPTASELTFPTVQGWDSAPTGQNAAGAGSTGNTAQVLQSTLKEASDAVTQSRKQMADLLTVQQQLLASTGVNTQALNANTTAKGGSGSSVLSTIGNVASGIFGSGSILSPIISGIMDLFGGGGSTPSPQILMPYIAPPSVQLQTTIGGPVPAPVATGAPTSAPGQTNATQGAVVQIQVNAMDSRSFMDHSTDIANAVRQALLNSHSLGDVIAEL